MNPSEIVTAFGAYYEKAAQNKNRILARLTQGLVTPSICTPIKTDDTVYKLSQLAIDNIVQSFQKAWTPRHATKFTPNELKLHQFKVDESIYPDDIEATWLGFLASDSVNRSEWPLIKYLIEHPDQGYLAKINSDMELLAYGHGEFVPPTPGQPNEPGQTMDGLLIQLERGVNGGGMNSINIGALNKDTIFDQIEAFVDGIANEYQHVNMDIAMSPKWARTYLRDKRANGFYDYKSNRDINSEVDFTPQNVKALPSLHGSDVIFATPKQNLLHLTKKSKNKTNIKIEEYRREVSLACDWWEGLGFGINEAVWTNIVGEIGG